MALTSNGTEELMQQSENESRVSQQLGAYISCLIIAYMGVAARLLCRRMRRTSLKTEDWLILVSLFFTTGFTGLNMSLTRDGLGRHEKYITNAKFFALGILIGEILYSLAIFIVKLSMLFLLHHIFPKRHFRCALWITGTVISSYTIVQVVCVVMHCVPVKALWDPTVPAYCINLDDVILVCSSFNIATDIAILILPMPELWNLQITTRQKLQLTSLFLLGGLVCIFSLVRITKLPQLSLSDPGWTSASSAMWSVVECCIATLSACLPTMRPIYDWLFGTKYPNASGETPNINAGRQSPLSCRQKPTKFQDANYNDDWPLKKPANPSSASVQLEMNPMHKT